MPPVILNVVVPPLVPLTDTVVGTIVNAAGSGGGITGALTVTVAEPDLPEAEAVTVKVVFTVTFGAVKSAVTKPSTVWANDGSVPPPPVVAARTAPRPSTRQ